MIIFALFLVAACGGESDGQNGSEANPDHDIQPFDVVNLDPDIGDGAKVSITGARVTSGGELQVLLEGFACGAPTKVEVEDAPGQVRVAAYGARYDDTADCTASIVPWFVTVDLDEPIGERKLVDDEGRQVPVSDCASDPSSELCNPPTFN